MAFRCGLGIGHFKIVESFQDNGGKNQQRILLIVGGKIWESTYIKTYYSLHIFLGFHSQIKNPTTFIAGLEVTVYEGAPDR